MVKAIMISPRALDTMEREHAAVAFILLYRGLVGLGWPDHAIHPTDSGEAFVLTCDDAERDLWIEFLQQEFPTMDVRPGIVLY